MRSFWKFLVPLGLVLPLGAFVTGSLVASAADAPSERDTIVIRESSTTPSTSPTATSSGHPGQEADDDKGDADDEVEPVTMEPDDVDDDSGPQAPYDDHGSDDSGHGSDDSGHGSGSSGTGSDSGSGSSGSGSSGSASSGSSGSGSSGSSGSGSSGSSGSGSSGSGSGSSGSGGGDSGSDDSGGHGGGGDDG
jgi:hypothetical protein